MELDDKFREIKLEAESFYFKIDSVYCPYLKTKVNFNVKGLNHIKMKKWNKSRPSFDQYLRLKFLKLVPDILTASGTLQEFHKTKNFERIKDTKNKSEWKYILKEVNYFAFVAIKKGVKIKIIVKKIERGEAYFWSVIPFWKSKKDPFLLQTKKVFHEGDLEND